MTEADLNVRAPIVVDVDAVVAFTRELVRVRSVYEPATGSSEAPAADLVVAKMREFGWTPEVVEVAPGRPNVVATVTGGAGTGPTLAFEGHLDVVTEGDSARWTVDPYAAVVRDGKLYGRGAADMKSGVAAMLYGVRALEQAGRFPGAVKVCLLSDEEGMMLGAKHLAASTALADVDGAIICEPEGGEVCPVAKGAIRLRIELTGTMAHGAMPERGRNPVPVLGRVLTVLDDLERVLQREHGEHEHLGKTYVTPTVALAGSAEQMNVLPSTATVWVDVRTIPGVDHGALIENVRRGCTEVADAAKVRSDVAVIDDRPPVDTPVDDAVVCCLMRAHEAVAGSPARHGGVPGTTDGTILSRDAGIPTVVYGPGGKWIAHQADEFVEVAEIPQYARVYAEAARLFLHGTGRQRSA